MSYAGIMHRDLKPSNILLDGDDVKIADFGMARHSQKKNERQKDSKFTRCGTVEYAAPQLFTGEYSMMCDVWSFGLVMVEMLTGNHPLMGIRYISDPKKMCAEAVRIHQTYFKDKIYALKDKKNRTYSEVFKRLVGWTLAYHEDDRVTFAELNKYLDDNTIFIEEDIAQYQPKQIKRFSDRSGYQVYRDSVYGTQMDVERPMTTTEVLQEYAKKTYFRLNRANNYLKVAKQLNEQGCEYPYDLLFRYALAWLNLACFFRTADDLMAEVNSKEINFFGQTIVPEMFDLYSPKWK